MTKTMAKTIEKLRPAIDEIIEQKIFDLLADPESFRPLSKKLAGRLKKGYKSAELKSLADVRQELGI